MLNPIKKFKVAILHLKRDWNHRYDIIDAQETAEWGLL